MPRPKQWTEPEVAAACRYHIERMRRNFEHGDYTFTQGQATDHIALLESAPSVEAFVGWLNDNTSAKGRSNMHAALRMARKRSRDKAPKPEPSRQAKAAPTRPADDGAQLRADPGHALGRAPHRIAREAVRGGGFRGDLRDRGVGPKAPVPRTGR